MDPSASCDVLDRAALLLDFDGTLVDIAPTPSAVRVPSSLCEDLATLAHRMKGAVALVSGRPIEQLDALLAPLVLAAAGEHGAAMRTAADRPVLRPPAPSLPQAWRDAAEALARTRPGVLVEHKGAGLVLHFRLAPEEGPALHAALAGLVAEAPAFEIMPASAAWEVRARGVHKGEAVRALMQAPAFQGRLPIFIGDDTTDEDGIAAAIALGGTGLRVPEHFGDAGGVRRWLAGLAAEARR